MAYESNGNNERTPKSSRIEQPLMSTGTNEAGFDWLSEKNNKTKKPTIGNTVVGEEQN
jgi:hypothetical protein